MKEPVVIISLIVTVLSGVPHAAALQPCAGVEYACAIYAPALRGATYVNGSNSLVYGASGRYLGRDIGIIEIEHFPRIVIARTVGTDTGPGFTAVGAEMIRSFENRLFVRSLFAGYLNASVDPYSPHVNVWVEHQLQFNFSRCQLNAEFARLTGLPLRPYPCGPGSSRPICI